MSVIESENNAPPTVGWGGGLLCCFSQIARKYSSNRPTACTYRTATMINNARHHAPPIRMRCVTTCAHVYIATGSGGGGSVRQKATHMQSTTRKTGQFKTAVLSVCLCDELRRSVRGHAYNYCVWAPPSCKICGTFLLFSTLFWRTVTKHEIFRGRCTLCLSASLNTL